MRDGFIRKKVQKVVSKTVVQINLLEAGKLPEYGFPWRRLNLHDMEFCLFSFAVFDQYFLRSGSELADTRVAVQL